MASYYVRATFLVTSAIEKARQTAASITDAATSRASGAINSVREAKASGIARVAALLDMTMSTVENIQRRGLRGWSSEVVRALRLAAGTRAGMLDAVARQALADAGERTKQGASAARVKATQVYRDTHTLVSQKSFQATAGSAVGGALTMGAGGGATGLAAGGVVGAVAGLPMALFTFGLSIPLGAAIGGGTGLIVGTAAGATTGAVGGGAVGYGAYQKKDDIAGAAKYVSNKATESARFVSNKASESASFVSSKASEGASQMRGATNKAAAYTKTVASNAKARVSGKANIDLKAN